MTPEESLARPTRQESAETRRRLLVTSSTFPLTADNGIPRFVYDLAEHLSRHMEVVAVVPDAPDAVRQQRIGRVDVHRFPYFWPRALQRLAYGGGMPDNLRSSLLARLQIPSYLACAVRELKRVIRQLKVDIVNAHWLVPQGLAAAIACGKNPDVKLTVHAHSSDVHLLRRLPGGGALARYIVERSDLVFASSGFVRSKLDEILESPSEALIQPMGVDRALFSGSRAASLSEDHPLAEHLDRYPDGLLLFVGRLVPVKGVRFLLEAMPKLLEHYPGLGLVIVGDGPGAPQLETAARDLEINESVAFEGALSHRDIAPFLRHSRALVLPSVVGPRGETEGMPTVLVEAMSSGTRVVASEVGGVTDLVKDGKTGWLCQPGDSTDLAAKILLAMADQDPSTIVSAAMRETTRYEWEEVARRYANALHGLLD